MKTLSVLTLGHSNHSMRTVLDLLGAQAVTAVADVRSQPYSRLHPEFNRESLEAALKEHDILYVHLGRELGGRPEDKACYENGRVQYGRVADGPSFKGGLQRVVEGAGVYRLALLCAEKEPLVCHRTLLVSRALDAAGVAVTHIHADGGLESHSDAMTRLLRLLGMPEADLFRSREQLIAEACAAQEQRVAYVDEKMRVEMN